MTSRLKKELLQLQLQRKNKNDDALEFEEAKVNLRKLWTAACFILSGYCLLIREAPYNKRDLERTRAPQALCHWSNLANTRAANSDAWHTLPGLDRALAKR